MEKIWFKNYPEGVPETIEPDQYPSLVAAFDEYCSIYAENIAFSNFGSDMTYRQLYEHTLSLAAFFQKKCAVKKGDRIALMMPNILQYPVALFAALRAGGVVVNVNPLYTAHELKQELNDSGATIIVVLTHFAHTVAEVWQETALKHVIVTDIGDLFGKLKGVAFNWVVKFILKMIPSWKIPHVYTLKKALEEGKKFSWTPPDIHLHDAAFLQYTGGTTGRPKGAILSHRNLLANILQCLAWVHGNLKIGEETLLAALPLYHVFSLMVSCFIFLAIGARCVLITNPRDLSGLISAWKKNSPTCFIGVNTLFLHLLKNPAFMRLSFKDLKITISGGMAADPKVAQAWQKLTGKIIIEGYGLTEASPVVTINPLNIAYFNHSIGLPIPATDVKICDDSGQEMPIDETGELWVKGPQVMKGYWQNAAETRAVLDADGWLRTGDLVRMDAQGFLYLVDRKKDLIIVSGFNVYPSEVENVLTSHPGIAEAAVIGVPGRTTGEAVKAIIVKKDAALTAEDILAYCRTQLTAYKIPKQIEFRDSLPKSFVGKILHRAL